MKVGAFIPIRCDSQRLPGKALMTIDGVAVFEHLVRRVMQVSAIENVSDIVICTTPEQTDDELVSKAQQIGCSVFRGAKDNLIKRFVDANALHQFDVILQVDGDDPLIPPEYCDAVISRVLQNDCDVAYTKNLPFGLNVKAFSLKALAKVFACCRTEKNDTGFGLYFLDRRLVSSDIVRLLSSSHRDDYIRLGLHALWHAGRVSPGQIV